MTMQLPPIPTAGLAETKSALHAAAKVLGDQLKRTRPRRKHWWHASLRLSLHGLTTGVIAGEVDVELEIDFAESELLFRSSSGETREVSLLGQSAREISDSVHAFYDSVGFVSDKSQRGDHERDETIQPDSSTEVAGAMGETFRVGASNAASLRAWIAPPCSGSAAGSWTGRGRMSVTEMRRRGTRRPARSWKSALLRVRPCRHSTTSSPVPYSR